MKNDDIMVLFGLKSHHNFVLFDHILVVKYYNNVTAIHHINDDMIISNWKKTIAKTKLCKDNTIVMYYDRWQ